MKKVLLVALLATLFIGTSYAQTVDFGLKAGYVCSTLEINDYKYTDEYRNAAFGGIFLLIKTPSRWAFQPELLYVPQGVKISSKIDNREVSSSFNLNYVQIPLLAKYYFTQKWCMEFGPQILILSTYNYKNEGIKTTKIFDNKITEDDVGIAFGFSYNVTYKICFNFRMNAGFKNIFSSDYKIRGLNRSVQFSLAYVFLSENRCYFDEI